MGNSDLKKFVESKGGTMFSSSWPWGNGDKEIIDFLKEGHKEGKQIEIYGYSRGGAAALRIADKLGKEGIGIRRLYTFDPHSATSGGFWRSSYSFELKHASVREMRNFYQRNQNYMFKPDNPFWGNPVKAKLFHHKGMNTNLTGHKYGGKLVNHNNIIRYIVNRLKLK